MLKLICNRETIYLIRFLRKMKKLWINYSYSRNDDDFSNIEKGSNML